MNEKLPKPAFVDPDDAPELDEEFFEKAVWSIGGKVVSREDGTNAMRKALGRPPLAKPKVSTTIRLDADVLDALKATGPGWQTRINDAMREWVARHQRPANI